MRLVTLALTLVRNLAGEFDNPGDVVVEVDEDDGISEVILSDAGGEPNTVHEFYLVIKYQRRITRFFIGLLSN